MTCAYPRADVDRHCDQHAALPAYAMRYGGTSRIDQSMLISARLRTLRSDESHQNLGADFSKSPFLLACQP